VHTAGTLESPAAVAAAGAHTLNEAPGQPPSGSHTSNVPAPAGGEKSKRGLDVQPASTLERWCRRLRDAAGEGLCGTPLEPGVATDAAARERFAAGFGDERGHRRRVDRPLLARLLGVSAGPEPTGPADAALWWALVSGQPDRGVPSRARRGPLLPLAGTDAIEVWTESELAALHAVFDAAVDGGDAPLLARSFDAARWHVANVQPDNATNHPWAVHVFAALGARDGDTGAELHAQTLLHNCQVQTGRPDRFSALVLLDAAQTLERYGAAQTGWR
jgi:hypothetical protein